ncbi:MAG: dihydroneopterin aldolase [Bacteroidota bacterium]|nr:dihydroneopterin aldolase [Bacteroidota bacterium]
MGLIHIEGMEFYAYHGHYEEEQIVGNRFLIDLQIDADCTKAARTDKINDAVNYQAAYKIVKKQMKKKSNLLENIANRIIDALYQEFDEVNQIKIKVSKMNPPMGGKIKKVSVTLKR